jgi:hypothetical protein
MKRNKPCPALHYCSFSGYYPTRWRKWSEVTPDAVLGHTIVAPEPLPIESEMPSEPMAPDMSLAPGMESGYRSATPVRNQTRSSARQQPGAVLVLPQK